MIARPPPSYEWTLHPGITDYGAVCTLVLLMDDDTAGADVEVRRGKIEGDAETNG